MHKAIPLCALSLTLALAAGAEAQSLRGSPASIDRMHRQAVQHGLDFHETAAGVQRAARGGELVRLTGNADYELKDVSQPYVVPAARTFVQRLATQYRAACGEKLVVTSATRPRSMRLANGSSRTVHPTGMAIDLRRPTRTACLAFLRETLSSLEARGVVEATEERNPPHFHVAVFPVPYERYAGTGSAIPRLASAGDGDRDPSPAAARTYRVRPGDSLWTIARRSNVSVETLRDVNGIRSSRIVAGQLLTIPLLP